MIITYYGYNTFLIEASDKTIAIDPGASFYFPDLFKTIIPKDKWAGISHLLVTHGDPDHYWHTDRVAAESGARLIVNESMIRGDMILGPRKKGLGFAEKPEKTAGILPGQSKVIDGIKITGIPALHGPLKMEIGPFRKTVHPGQDERIGFGSMGFLIEVAGFKIMNLGDSLLLKDEWEKIPVSDLDVLMIPIGGRNSGNTMDEDEALEAVELFKPRMVIPCHYDCPGFFKKNANPADSVKFKDAVENMDVKCLLLKPGESDSIK